MKRFLSFVVVFAAALAVYMGNDRAHPSGDTVPARLVPISLLTECNLDLDEFYESIYPGKRYCVLKIRKHWLSSYPLGPAFTALPIYAVAGLFKPDLYTNGMEPYFAERFGDEEVTVAYRMEKWAAAIIAALSVAFMWLILGRLAGGWGGAALTAAYAFGTPMMSSASQALWTHGPSCLALAIALYLLLHPSRRPMFYALAGLAAGWAFFCRPSNALPLAVLGPWILYRGRWSSVAFVIGAAIVAGAASFLNYEIYGNILGGYNGQTTIFTRFIPEAMEGVLLSPSRGLFVFSPFLLFATICGIRRVVRSPLDWGAGCMLAASASIALYGFWPDWSGGYSFGPRMLCDAVPFLMIPLAEDFDWIRRSRTALGIFAASIVLSCWINGMGAYRGDGGWNGGRFDGANMDALWDVRDSQVVRTLF